jgi:outer membrane lipase/esterase
MPRTKLLVSALALALAGATTAQAQTFSAVISFGDSISDAGQYASLGPYSFGAGSFTTNPDDVWVQIVAESFGLTSAPSMAGGTNYAWGGAPTSFSVPGVPLPLFCVPTSLPCKSAAQQIAAAGPVDPNALYTYFADANDIFNYVGYASLNYITSAQAQAYTAASAMNQVKQIAGLQAAGAKTIVVLNLPDIGRAPNFTNTALFPSQASPAAAAALSGLTFVNNTTLNAGLATLADGIVPINVYALFNELLADPSAYGITNTTGTACNLLLTGGSSLFCTPAAYRTPDANETYLFADGVHPSGVAHRMLASIVVATLEAPGQVSMAGELPLQLYDNHSSVINDQIFGMSSKPRSPGESNLYGSVDYTQTSFNASGNTGALDSDLFSATFGADVRYSDTISLGAAISVGNSNADNGGASIGGTEVLVSAYGVAHFGSGYLDAIVSGGSNNLEIDRSIVLGTATRVESGSTSASHTAFALGAGFSFGSETFSHGPFVSWTWQEVSVDGYSEDGLDSTSMYFSEFSRNSSVARAGYQLSADAGGWRPFGRVAFAKDNDASATAVQAGSNTLNGHFTLDGFQAPSDWTEADVGVNYTLDEGTSLSLTYRGRFSDDTQDVNSINFGARWEF